VAKPVLGTKRVCPNCGTKYYDLNKDPIVCPHCGTVFEVAAPPARAPERKVEPQPKEPVEATEVEREADVISLEEVEEGGAEAEAEDGDEAVDIPDEEEIEVEEDDTVPDPFLEEEEEEGDDVSGLLDVDDEDEEER
jgi:uncharacterized protein (TIGR02300 family)